MAATNHIIHMRIDLDGSKAEKAWTKLIESIEAKEKELAAMRKAGLKDTEQYRNLQSELKLMKSFKSDMQATYADISTEVEHLATQSMNRIDALIRNTQKQIKTLDPTKNLEELQKLSAYEGALTRERESRLARQREMQARTAEEIIKESRLTQEQILQQSLLSAAYNTAVQDRQKKEAEIIKLQQSHNNALQKTANLEADINDKKRRRAEVEQNIANLNNTKAAETAQKTAELEQKQVDLKRLIAEKEQEANNLTLEGNGLLEKKQQQLRLIENYRAKIAEAEAKGIKHGFWDDSVANAESILRNINAAMTDNDGKVRAVNADIAQMKAEYDAAGQSVNKLRQDLLIYLSDNNSLREAKDKLNQLEREHAALVRQSLSTDEAKKQQALSQLEAKKQEVLAQDALVKQMAIFTEENLRRAALLMEAERERKNIDLEIAALEAKKPKSNVDEAKVNKRLETLRAARDAAVETEKQAKAAFDAIMQKAAESGDAFKLPHDHLKKLAQELQFVINTSSDTAAIAKWREELANMNAEIKRMEMEPLRNFKTALADVDAAKSITQMEMLSTELKKIFSSLSDPAQKNEVKAAFENLDAKIIQSKMTLRDEAQIKVEYARAQELVRQGTAANAEEVRRHIQIMRECEASDKINLSLKQEIAGSIRQLDELYKGNNTTTMTATEAELAYNKAQELVKQGGAAKTSEMRNMVRAMQEAMLVSGLTMETEQKYAKMLQYGNDMLQGKIQNTMTEAQAEQYQLQTQKALEAARSASINGTKLETAEYLRLQDAVRQAMGSQHISIQLRQQLAASDRELEQVLKGSSVTTMQQAEAERILAEAKLRLTDIDKEEVGVIQAYINQLGLARNANGVQVEQSREMASVQKQMQDALNKTAKTYMTLADAEAIATGMQKADESAKRSALEALKHYAQQENDLAKRTALNDKIRKLEASFKKMGGAASNAFDAKFVNATLKNIDKAPIEDLEKALKMVENRMKSIDQNSKTWAKRTNQYSRLRKQVDEANASLGKTTQHLKDQDTWFAKAGTKLMNYLGIFGGFYLVRQNLQKWFQMNIKFDDQLTNIRKTTNMTSAAIEQLSDDIKHINTRTSVENLNELAYTAGKLGLQSVSDVMGFVRAADMLNVALGEQLGDNATEQLMKISNIMGIVDDYGMQDALTKTGSAITYLAKSSAASAQPIVDFMKRTAGIARQSGITTSELAGLGAAVSALNQPVEMSATSFSKMMVQMEKDYKKVAAALQMTDEETERLRLNLETGNSMEAFLNMLEKVKELGGLSMTASIAKDLGSEGNRVIQTLTTLSSNYDTIAKMVRKSTEAFTENVTVLDEYNKKNENTAALWERLKNNITKIFVSPAATQYIKNFLQSIQTIPQSLKEIVSALKPFGEVIGKGLVKVLTDFNYVLTGILKAMTLNMFVSLLSKSALWIGNVASSMVAFGPKAMAFVGTINWASLSFKGLRSGAKSFFTFLKSAQFGNVFTAIIATIWMFVDYVNKSKVALKQFKRDTEDSLANVQQTAEATTVSVRGLLRELENENTTMERKQQIYDELNNTYKDYLSYLDIENGQYENMGDLIERVNTQLQIKQYLEAKKARVQEIQSQGATDAAPLRTAVRESVLAAMGVESGKATQAQRSTAEAIVNELLKNKNRILDFNAANEAGDRYDNDYVVTRKMNLEEQAKAKAVYESFGGTHVITGNDSYNAIAQALRDYVNQLDKTQLAIEETEIEFNAQAQMAGEGAEKAAAGFKSTMDKVYGTFSENFTQGGQFDVTTELSQGVKDQWAILKRSMGKDERNKEIDSLNTYIEAARSYVQDIELIKGAESEEYKKAYNEYLNAKAYKEILELGNIKTTEENNPTINRQGKDAYAAVMAIIKEFYANEENKLQSLYNNGKIDATQLELRKERNTYNLNETEAIAREGIVLDGQQYVKAWNERLATMIATMLNTDLNPEVVSRLKAVGPLRNVGIKAVKGKETEEVGAGTKWVNGVKKERAENRLQMETIDSKQFKAVQQALLEYDRTGKVMAQYADSFQRLGIMFADLTKRASDGNKELRVVTREVMEIYRNIGENLYHFDVNTEEGLYRFKAELIKYPEFAEMAAVATTDQLKLLYYELFKFNNEYIEAQRKAASDAEKISKYIWERSSYYRQNQASQQRNNLIKSGVWQHTSQGRSERNSIDKMETRQSPRVGVYGSRSFMEEWAPDMELENYRLKMEASEEYVQQLLREQATEERVRAAQVAADSASMEYVKRLTDQYKAKQEALMSLYKPIEDFGSAVGSALWQLRSDAKESHEATREAVREMIKAFGKQTIEMTNQYIQRRMMQTINDYLVSRQMRKAAADEVIIAKKKNELLEQLRQEEIKNGRKFTTQEIDSAMATLEGNLRRPKNEPTRQMLKAERKELVGKVKAYNNGQADRNAKITSEAEARLRATYANQLDTRASTAGVAINNKSDRDSFISELMKQSKENGDMTAALRSVKADISAYNERQAELRKQADKQTYDLYENRVRANNPDAAKAEIDMKTRESVREAKKRGDYYTESGRMFEALDELEKITNTDYADAAKFDKRNFAADPYEAVMEQRRREADINDFAAPDAAEVKAPQLDTTNSLLGVIASNTDPSKQRSTSSAPVSTVASQVADAAVDVAGMDESADVRTTLTEEALEAGDEDLDGYMMGQSYDLEAFEAFNERYLEMLETRHDEEIEEERRYQEILQQIRSKVTGIEASGSGGTDGEDSMGSAYGTGMSVDGQSYAEQIVDDGNKVVDAKAKVANQELKQQVKDNKKKENETKSTVKEQVKAEEKGEAEKTDNAEEGGQERKTIALNTGNAINSFTSDNLAENIAMGSAANMAKATADLGMAKFKTLIGISEASSETLGQLGYWGIPLVAVISATLNALMSAAMSGFSSLFGSSSSNDAATPKTKLVSGMLTYDKGNVQSFRAAIAARTFDKGGDLRSQMNKLMKQPGIINMVQDTAGTWVPEYMQTGKMPVMGDDGKMYSAVEKAVMQTGLITEPTLTGLGGAPALVGERGPEMVIGRETTQALMTDFPGLMKALIEYDANHSKGFAKTFDNGNLSEFAQAIQAERGTSQPADDSEIREVLAGTQAAMLQLAEMSARLNQQLERGIHANLNMYGTGGALDKMAEAFTNAKKLGYNKNVNHLFSGK